MRSNGWDGSGGSGGSSGPGRAVAVPGAAALTFGLLPSPGLTIMPRPTSRIARPAPRAAAARRLVAAAALLVACRAPDATLAAGPRALPSQLRADVTYLA